MLPNLQMRILRIVRFVQEYLLKYQVEFKGFFFVCCVLLLACETDLCMKLQFTWNRYYTVQAGLRLFLPQSPKFWIMHHQAQLHQCT